MLKIRKPTKEEIDIVKERLKKGLEIYDDRNLWIWRDYLW